MVFSFIIFINLLGQFFLTPAAHSFTLNNNIEATFTENDVFINVANASCEHLGLTHEQLLDLAQRATDQFWNVIPTSRLRLKRGKIIEVNENTFKTESLCTPDSYDASNGRSSCLPNSTFYFSSGITLVCNQNTLDFPSNSSVLAATLPFIEQENIKSAVILLNDTPGALRANPYLKLNENQVLSVLAHEIGHAFGLGHSEVVDSLMYFAIVPQRDRLGKDDIDGLTYLYSNKDYFLGSHFCGSTNFDQNPSPPFFLQFFLGLLLFFFIRKIVSAISFRQ